jgi:2-amino-4-hydroxy-6-hydroxymethyldihydropteridine diphosphokinase
MQIVIGLGGNSGEVAASFSSAAGALATRFRLVASSGIWRTAPIGPPQDDFLNAALLLDVDADLFRVLAWCQALEVRAGRRRQPGERNRPRPLDLDILLAEEVVVVSPALVVPHPRLALRRFALLPACEVAAGWRHPRLHRPLDELAATLAGDGQRCDRLGSFPPPRR